MKTQPLTQKEKDAAAEKINAELAQIYGAKEVLTAEEQAEVASLEAKFSKVLEAIGDKEATAEQSAELDAINARLEVIYGAKPDSELTEAELARVQELHTELADLSACEDQISDQLQSLFDQLHTIKGGLSLDELSPEDEAKAIEIGEQIEAQIIAEGNYVPGANEGKLPENAIIIDANGGGENDGFVFDGTGSSAAPAVEDWMIVDTSALEEQMAFYEEQMAAQQAQIDAMAEEAASFDMYYSMPVFDEAFIA